MLGMETRLFIRKVQDTAYVWSVKEIELTSMMFFLGILGTLSFVE